MQFFIFENIVYYIKIFLKSLNSSNCQEDEAYTLTLKYDIYVFKFKNLQKLKKKLKKRQMTKKGR